MAKLLSFSLHFHRFHISINRCHYLHLEGDILCHHFNPASDIRAKMAPWHNMYQSHLCHYLKLPIFFWSLSSFLPDDWIKIVESTDIGPSISAATLFIFKRSQCQNAKFWTADLSTGHKERSETFEIVAFVLRLFSSPTEPCWPRLVVLSAPSCYFYLYY